MIQKSRADILQRFLTEQLVMRFSDNLTMEDNLKQVLYPRTARAAMLQADVRGYSALSEKHNPLEMVKILQSYYKPVVDEAQDFESDWWVSILSLLRDDDGVIYLFQDAAQNIFSREKDAPIKAMIKPASAIGHPNSRSL